MKAKARSVVIDYPKLLPTHEVSPFLREVFSTTERYQTFGWRGIMIYHPATEQYYATWAKDPTSYYRLLRAREEPLWSRAAVALKQMLEINPEFQLFILPVHARQEVERWMSNQGKRRVTTKRGEAATCRHILVKVTSVFHKLTRYTTVPEFYTDKQILGRVNLQFDRWLREDGFTLEHERRVIMTAVRAKFSGSKQKTFELESVIERTNAFDNVSHNEFSARVREFNLRSVRDFIRSTTQSN